MGTMQRPCGARCESVRADPGPGPVAGETAGARAASAQSQLHGAWLLLPRDGWIDGWMGGRVVGGAQGLHRGVALQVFRG